MDALKVACMILVALLMCQFVLVDTLIDNDVSKKVLLEVPYDPQVAAEKSGISNLKYQVCAKVCNFCSCTTYYCAGDGICCTPGSPTSKCCPESHPLCLLKGCCPNGYPKICGRYCCKSGSFCCDDRNCCKAKKSCCGETECCTDEAPCCKEDGKKRCCNKDIMACCEGYGCVEPCESQFDAVGCELRVRNEEEVKELNLLLDGLKVTFDELYRIIRPDEDCSKGLFPKNIHATKTVLSHVNCGSRSNYQSQFVSTTASFEVAQYYKKKAEEKGISGLRIVKIPFNQIPKGSLIVDLTNEENRVKYLGRAVCKNFAKASQEVLLASYGEAIPCEVIEDGKDEL